jgi:hypothetical protein
MTIRLVPGRSYLLTREVFRAVMEDFLRHEERMARTLEHRQIIAEFRDEWGDPKRFERWFQMWRTMLTLSFRNIQG